MQYFANNDRNEHTDSDKDKTVRSPSIVSAKCGQEDQIKAEVLTFVTVVCPPPLAAGHPDAVCHHRGVLGSRPGCPSDSTLCRRALRWHGAHGQAVRALWLRGEDPRGDHDRGREVDTPQKHCPHQGERGITSKRLWTRTDSGSQQRSKLEYQDEVRSKLGRPDSTIFKPNMTCTLQISLHTRWSASSVLMKHFRCL